MKHQKKVLKNGLRVIFVPLKENPTVTVLVMVEAGSKYETKEINGLSHFLEHLCFKGTEKRPKPTDISGELDGIGAEYNAFTSQEFTGYFAKAHRKHANRLLDIVADLYQNPIFRTEDIDRERGVIIEEINMYEDLPQRQVHETYMELLYGDQPAGWSIAGPKEVIRRLSQEEFISYRNKHYVSKATTVVISGAFDRAQILKQIQEKFSGMSSGKKHSKIKVQESQQKPQVRIKEKKTDQAHLILGFRSMGVTHKDELIASFIAAILAGGMSSRLFVRLREKMGVCYYVKAFQDSYTDHGSLFVATGVDTKRVQEVIRALLEEYTRLTKELISDEELNRVKESVIGKMILGLEASDDVAEYIGIQEILRTSIVSPEERAKKIRAITANDIRRVARKIITEKRMNLALIGPFNNVNHFTSILKLPLE